MPLSGGKRTERESETSCFFSYPRVGASARFSGILNPRLVAYGPFHENDQVVTLGDGSKEWVGAKEILVV